MAALPTIIPIFPLPNLVLFPGLNVPLHIFEPRYREMIADVADLHGMIGMALLKGDRQRDYHAFPDIFEVGSLLSASRGELVSGSARRARL